MTEPEENRRCRWHQFSLRTLLAVIAVMAGLAFGWTTCIEPYRLQREAMVVITKLGGTYKTADATDWIRYLDRTAQDVVVVDLADCDKPNEYLPHLARLPKLRSLVLGGHMVGDEQLAVLRGTSLRGLVLDSTLVSDEAVGKLKETGSDLVACKSGGRAIRELKRLGAHFGELASPTEATAPPDWLRSDVGDVYFAAVPLCVYLWGTRVNDGDLVWLLNLVQTRTLYAGATSIGDQGLTTIAGLPSLEVLELGDTLVTDEGLAHLHRSKNLKRVSLGGTQITDSGLPYLEKLGQVTIIGIRRTRISADGAKRLRQALPHCTIFR